MTDYSKIDFTKLKLPEWLGRQYAIRCYGGGFIHIRNESVGSIAVRHIDAPGTWKVTRQIPDASFEDLDQLKTICAQADAFIAAELKRIDEESLPAWRDCLLEEAIANPQLSEYQFRNSFVQWSRWAPIAVRSGNCLEYRYRTRAPKQSPKMPTVKAPDGCYWDAHESGQIRLAHRMEDGSTGFKYVPRDKLSRDKMLACVAAYDLDHGLGPEYVLHIDGAPTSRSFYLVEVAK